MLHHIYLITNIMNPGEGVKAKWRLQDLKLRNEGLRVKDEG